MINGSEGLAKQPLSIGSKDFIQKESITPKPQDETISRLAQKHLPIKSPHATNVKSVTPLSGQTRSISAKKPPEQELVEREVFPTIVLPGEPSGPRPLLQRMRELNVPGVSITVIENGKEAWSEGYGDLDPKKHPGVLTQAASISKTVTALTILSLVQDGLLDLDTDVGQLLRERLGPLGKEMWKTIYPEDLEGANVPKITVRQLLSHTSGIPGGGSEYYSINQIDRQFLIDLDVIMKDFQLTESPNGPSLIHLRQQLEILCEKRKSPPSKELDAEISKIQKDILLLLTPTNSPISAKYTDRLNRLSESQKCRENPDLTSIPSLEDILLGNDRQLGPIHVTTPPGTKFEYSNPGFTVLQMVVQAATGNKFEQEVQKRVLDPLGMSNSTYSPPIEQTAQGNDTDGRPLPESWHVLPHLASGGLWTTSEDYAKVVLAIQGSRADLPMPGAAAPFIRQDLAHEMELGTPTSQQSSYGLGLGLDRSSATTYFAHNGSIRGFRTLFIANDFDPKNPQHSGNGVVIMTNSQNGEDLYPEILASVARAYNWPNRDKLALCQPPVHPNDLYKTEQEAKSLSNTSLWEKRAGDYVCETPDGKQYFIHVSVDEKDGKITFQPYEKAHGEIINDKAITCVPIGPSIAYHPPDGQGFLQLPKFDTVDGKTILNIFGGAYSRLS